MLGLILLITFVVAFVARRYAISLMGYLFFAFDCFFLIPREYLGASGGNYAIVYVLVVGILSIKLPYRRKLPIKLSHAATYMIITIAFLCLNTIIYYNLDFSSVTIYVRELFFLLSIFIFLKIPSKDIRKTISWMLSITIVLTVIYIYQALSGTIVFQTNYEDSSLLRPVQFSNFSLYRVQNSPAWIPIFLIFAYISKTPLLKTNFVSKMILTFGLIANQSRTMIVSAVLSILYGMSHLRIRKDYLRVAIFLGFFVIVGNELLMYRFVEEDNYGNTVISQVTSISSFDLNSTSNNIEDGTFIYRLAWCAERFNGILESGEINKFLFGLGMMTEEYAQKIYHFRIGNPSLTGGTVQLFTYDTDYGNILVRYGLIGGVVIVYFIYQVFLFFYKRRKTNTICLTITSIFITIPFFSYSSTTYTRMSYYIVIFLFVNIILDEEKDDLVSNTIIDKQ